MGRGSNLLYGPQSALKRREPTRAVRYPSPPLLVQDLNPKDFPEGCRIEVIAVTQSQSEELGYVDDTERLLGKHGTLRKITGSGSSLAQVEVDWDDSEAGTLMLSGGDQIARIK